MALPAVDKVELDRALIEFDEHLRDSPAWLRWEESAAQLYAIVKNGRRYPSNDCASKPIVSKKRTAIVGQDTPAKGPAPDVLGRPKANFIS